MQCLIQLFREGSQPHMHRNAQVSRKYAWLPTDVSIAADGTATFDAYINNLHPEVHCSLYTALQDLLTACVPLLERTLQQALVMPHKAIAYNARDLREPLPEEEQLDDDEMDALEALGDDGPVMDAILGPMVNFPTVPAAYDPPVAPVGAEHLRSRTLQVIVKVRCSRQLCTAHEHAAACTHPHACFTPTVIT